MAIYISAALIAVISLISGLKYADIYIHKRDETAEKSYFTPKFLVPFVLICTAFCVFSVFVMKKNQETTMDIIRYVTVICGLSLSSVTDIKLKLIPNVFCLSMIAACILEIAVSCIFFKEALVYELMSSLIGGVFGGGLLLIGRLISRNGMGMGDVKILFAAGLLLRFEKMFGLLFWGLIFSVFFGVGLMIFKKVKSSHTISMAPFFLSGAAAMNIIAFISQIVYEGV